LAPLWGLKLRSDHGPKYTGGDCEALCHYWGIEHTSAPVGGFLRATRWPNVFIQRLKVELVWTRDWETIAELRQAITLWMEQYNHQRPHQALDRETRTEPRAKNLSASWS
jgi:transposase InsO family protein